MFGLGTNYVDAVPRLVQSWDMVNRNCPEYRTWMGMKARCADLKNHRYGGRGIRVCKRWRESFAAFLADMGPRPPGMTIDRINNDGNYTPRNCRWATRTEQSRNREGAVKVTLNGETMALAEAAKRYGLDYGVAAGRMSLMWSAGMTAEEAFAWPVGRTPEERGRLSWILRRRREAMRAATGVRQ